MQCGSLFSPSNLHHNTTAGRPNKVEKITYILFLDYLIWLNPATPRDANHTPRTSENTGDYQPACVYTPREAIFAPHLHTSAPVTARNHTSNSAAFSPGSLLA